MLTAGGFANAAQALTNLLYSGEQTDKSTGLQYLRARYYDPRIGRFNRLDPFAGNSSDPLSLHKYLYVHGDPIAGIDPSGREFSVSGLAVSVAIQSGIGATLGLALNAAANYAQGRALTYGAWQAAVAGAVLAPAAAASSLLAVGLAGYGIYASSDIVETVFSNPNSTIGQRATAVALLGASIFGGYAAAKNVRLGGFWRENPTAASLDSVTIRATGQPQPTLRTVSRVPQDVNVNSTPPPANGGAGSIGSNTNQAAALQRYITELLTLGARDIRTNQQQVNAAGQRVGINRPDLQFTYEGRRWYIEWDTTSSLRGIPHGERILANDPDAMILLFSLD
jgi:RHS repeat-associated protein